MAGLADKISTSGILRRRGQRVIYALGLFLLFGTGLAIAWWQIGTYESSLEKNQFTIEEAGLPPVSALEIRPREIAPETPVLIIAHGFSANKETMQAIGVESALRLGLRVILIDFPGHGRSPERFPTNMGESIWYEEMSESLDAVYRYTRRNYPNSPVAMAAHSMGTGLISRFAQRTPELQALILISPAGMPAFPAKGYRNLLVLVGEADIGQSIDNAKKVYALSTGAPEDSDFPPDSRQTTGAERGNPAEGSGVRLRVLSGTNHITILYISETMLEVNSWLDRSLFKSDGKAVRAAILEDHNGAGFRLRWTIVGLLFSICLVFPLASLVIDLLKLRAVLSRVPLRPALSQSLLFMGIILLAFLVSALLWTPFKPPAFLVGLQLGSYLAGFFLVAGLLSWGWLIWWHSRQRYGPRFEDYSRYWGGVITTKTLAWLLAPGLLFACVYFGLGLFSAATWESLQFTPGRVLPFIVLALCLFPYFMADEYVFRRMSIWQGYFLSLLGKVGLLAILVLAVLLSPSQLGFLMILLPVLAILYVIFGLFSIWLFWLGRDFVMVAVLQTLLFAWVISGFFPLI